jgi:hypothetical protein
VLLGERGLRGKRLRDPNADEYTHSDAHQYPDGDADTNGHPNGDADRHPDAHPDSDPHEHAHGDGDTDAGWASCRRSRLFSFKPVREWMLLR